MSEEYESLPDPDDDLPGMRARSGDPVTSEIAMAMYDSAKMKAAAAVVVKIYQQHGRLADFELAMLFEIAFSQPHCDHLYRQARSTARDKGLIRATADRKVNPATKRLQIVWEACQDAPPEIPRCPTCGKVIREPVPSKGEST